ncbi:MAG: polysaccharide deacetylase [Desulfobacterium sp.]|nr:polysaccharide deacetylase [Desulfobacterium sp.]
MGEKTRLKEDCKTKIAQTLCKLNIDGLLRWVNKNSLLVVTYHGVYDKFCRGTLPLFTHLHVDLLREHLKFLKSNYNVISLSEFTSCLKERKPWPERAALITFDDGLRNNYEVAFPVLKEFDLPAVIYLTVNYIGTDKLLWFDELYLLLKKCLEDAVKTELLAEYLGPIPDSCDIGELYPICSKRLKNKSIMERMEIIKRLKQLACIEGNPILSEPFKFLSWEQVLEMKSSGLIEFGVHTATHRMVSELSPDEWEKEIVAPKNKIEKIIGNTIDTFCYPNGVPDVDFFQEHEKFLKSRGYVCAFSAHEGLNSPKYDQYRLGRISVGSDISSEINFFRLNTAGFISFLRTKLKFIT